MREFIFKPSKAAQGFVETLTGNHIKAWLDINERSQNWFAGKIGVSTPRLNYWIKNNTDLKEDMQKRVEKVMKTF